MPRLATLALLAATATAAPRIESNVIYGMHSGLAMIMDVWVPERPNGYGVIFISGSGWHAPLERNAVPLSHNEQTTLYAPVLSRAGYTVFSLSHRAAPRFRYPAALEDAQRAVRFIRHNAARWNIRPDRIGATGGSSGGNLVLLLGTLDGKPVAEPHDDVDKQSAKVQCVVARAAPADLTKMAVGAVVSYIGRPAPAPAFAQASPVTHVTPDDPPAFLMHGDKDDTVPLDQAHIMAKALTAAGVPTQTLIVPGGKHGPDFGRPPGAPDYMAAMVAWLDQHLKR